MKIKNLVFALIAGIGVFSACTKIEAPEQVNTKSISFVSASEVKCVGEVFDGEELQYCGFVYSAQPAPEFESDVIIPAPPTSRFEATLNNWDIEGNDPVYIRAFAMNSGGITYGQEFQFPKIIDDEDFESSTWTSTSDTYEGYEYSFKTEGGYYKMTFNYPGHFQYEQKFLNLSSSSNYLMEINFKRIRDDPTYKDCHLYFGYGKSSSSVYYLIVEPGDDSYYIGFQNQDNWDWTEIKDWTKNYGLNGSANNKLQIHKMESTYYFYINGSRVYTWNTSTIITPIIRLGVSNGEIWVDDYSILKLTVGENLKSAEIKSTTTLFTSGEGKSINKQN